MKRRLLGLPLEHTPTPAWSPLLASNDVADWVLTDDAWKQFGSTVQARWRRLTDEHLEAIGGRRERLARSVRSTYGLPMAQVEVQLRSFEAQHRLLLTSSAPA